MYDAIFFNKYCCHECKLLMTIHLLFCAITEIYFGWQVTPRFFCLESVSSLYSQTCIAFLKIDSLLKRDTNDTETGKIHSRLLLTKDQTKLREWGFSLRKWGFSLRKWGFSLRKWVKFFLPEALFNWILRMTSCGDQVVSL